MVLVRGSSPVEPEVFTLGVSSSNELCSKLGHMAPAPLASSVNGKPLFAVEALDVLSFHRPPLAPKQNVFSLMPRRRDWSLVWARTSDSTTIVMISCSENPLFPVTRPASRSPIITESGPRRAAHRLQPVNPQCRILAPHPNDLGLLVFSTCQRRVTRTPLDSYQHVVPWERIFAIPGTHPRTRQYVQDLHR